MSGVKRLQGRDRDEGDGRMRMVELHWYEAHGIGKRNMRIKRILGLP